MAPTIRSPSLLPCRRICRASLHAPLSPKNKEVALPKMQSFIPLEDLMTRGGAAETKSFLREKEGGGLLARFLAIADAAADRAEMHAIIGEQRNNWGHHFLHSINSITLTASLMSGLACAPVEEPTSLAFKLSAVVLFTAATGMMLLVNKIQPSQLAEEQRNASRLFKQLEKSVHTSVALRSPNEACIEEAMERMLALQKAYPLPLLPGMLEKFPKVVQPTRWWPKVRTPPGGRRGAGNGWSVEMEEEMRGVLRVLKNKDEVQYVEVGELILKINQTLAYAGPLLAGVAAVAAASIGGGHGSLPVVVGMLGGVLSAVTNTLEHGGQMGMVFELLRNCAGYYRRLEEEIEFNLAAEEEQREEGELFELKMALQLGRSLPELREMASYSSSSSSPCEDKEIKEFAGKLF
ncbi:hypothetical protein HPP92_023974 [Vanilla planifolia]|uniref:F-box protein n=1 Tax=Vanilla planifolia TaxID=51239 RepID=A0A835PNB8_VANPL|nr:hypothetical protein HPP92_023974 [Vanilla planifolia]